MERFSKVKRNKEVEEKILFGNDYMRVIEYEGWTIMEEPDSVVCIPYIIEYNQFIIRQEYIPSYKLDSGKDLHLTVLSGTIEENETPEQTLRRELEEEAGIVLRDNFEFNMEAPIFKFKGSSSKYHLCILPLTESDYHEVIASGDGSEAEKMSKSVKINIKHINSLILSDTITELMLCKLKKYLNMNI